MAARLKQHAATISSSGRGIHGRLRSMTFEGPAADRFRDRLESGRRTAETISGDAVELANGLLRAAASAEAALNAWAAQVAAMQERDGS
jgi:hypothetical protein